MSNFTTNITVDAVQQQIDAENQKKVAFVNTFDVRNYLNVRLAKDEKSKTLTIRLLPSSPTSNTPFEKVHMHTIKVNKEIAESGWKTFVCPVNNHMGDKCPFCELSEEAKRLKYATSNEQEKQKYKEVENLNRSREMWIVRCIERGHEGDGVKFWLIPNSKDGAYAKIMAVYNTRLQKAKEKGRVYNIFDLNEGKDLDVTITRSADGKSVISVVDSDEKTPLTEDFDLGMKWINDEKKWSDVYKVKPYEYMSVIVQGGVPVFDKIKGIYVDRDEANAEKQEFEKANVTEQKVDYTQMPSAKEVAENNSPNIFKATEVIEDLPF